MDMKAKIDEFKPVVPIAMALRKDGMVDRHWDAISKEVGFEINPSKEEGFTLQKACDRGMLKHTELCDEIGEKAYKEHHIEKSLKKMQADWEGLDFALPQFK